MCNFITQSRRIQMTLKIIAIICGCYLILASAYSETTSFNLDLLLNYFASQVQSSTQLQWLWGIIFLTAGIFYSPTRFNKSNSFKGLKELNNDSYILYLLDKHQIHKNLVLDQFVVRDKIFSGIDDALKFAHEIECSNEIHNLQVGSASSAPASLSVQEKNLTSSEAPANSIRNLFLNSQVSGSSAAHHVAWDRSKRIKVTIIAGVLLFVALLGGLFYANYHFTSGTPQPIVSTVPDAPLSETSNSDQVVTGSLVGHDTSIATEAKEVSQALVTPPINERWIGLWVSEGGGKQKLLVAANLLKYGDEEFTWTGVRPKGVVQGSLAFYEGSTTKSDLLARIAGAQDASAVLKPEAQKTLALVNGLSEANFKRIVFTDPYLKKYFFIYDQNFVYRITRDLGDKVDVVVEQFKKQD